MPAFPPLLARLARYTVLVLVGFLLLFAAAWKGWIFRSDRQYLPRLPDPKAIAVPNGYRVELLATGLNGPSGLEITPDGSLYISESGYGGAYAATAGYEGVTAGRILKLNQNGILNVVAGGFAAPLTGFLHDAKGTLYVSENGAVTVINGSTRREIVSGLPSLGDHKNNNLVFGPDGKLYLTQGTVTNSGIVGLDNWVLWGRYLPSPRDVPCRDIVLRGVNVQTADPRSVIPFMRVETGAYSPFGHKTVPGQVIQGQVPCGGSVMRFNPDGSDLELVAWGMRNPFDLRFDKSGQLYVTDNGPDTRGSRPLDGVDLLYQVRPGAWYGWPDYWNGRPVTEMIMLTGEKPRLLLGQPPAPPEKAYMTFDEHAAAAGFDFAPAAFGFEGEAFVAQWGTGFPATSQEPALAGFHVVRLDLRARKTEVFAANRLPGPASLIPGRRGFERPVVARFGPDGALYVLDWGHMAVTRKGPYHVPDSGALWRISRVGTAPLPFTPATPQAFNP